MKLTPCVGLTVLSLLLVQTMKEAEARRQNLRGGGGKTKVKAKVKDAQNGNQSPSSADHADVTAKRKDESAGATGSAGGGGGQGRDRKTNRTTRMLLVVVALFLVTEFPQGVINLLSGVLEHFVEEVNMALGDLLDILALINNGINFILYCTMSKQFRDTFVRCFHLQALVELCSSRGAKHQSSANATSGNGTASSHCRRTTTGNGSKSSATAIGLRSEGGGAWRKQYEAQDGVGQTTALLSPEANGCGSGNTGQASLSAVEPTISACSWSGEA